MKSVPIMCFAMLIQYAGTESVAQQKQIQAIIVSLNETTRHFAIENDLLEKFVEIRDSGSAFFEVYFNNPTLSGLQLRYRSKACQYDFPPGRWLEVGQTAGRISLLTLFMPLDTLSFPQAVASANQLRTGLSGAGWTETTWVADPEQAKLNANPFEPGTLRLGVWNVCGLPNQTATLSIKDAGQQVAGTSVPLGGQIRKSPVRPGGEFLLHVEITLSDKEFMALTALAAARRQAVNGDREKELPARVWIDDPDWRPQTQK